MPPPSEKRLAANRANAKKSTGPRTPQGKARSSMNALVHGLSAKSIVLPNEDRRAYQRFARAMRRDLEPSGAMETVLVERVIQAAWRLRRAGQAQWDVALRAQARYGASANDVSPGRLLADALAGDERAAVYLEHDRLTEQLQRSFFTALRRLNDAKRLSLREPDEPIFGGFGAAGPGGVSDALIDDYAGPAGGANGFPTTAGTENEPNAGAREGAPRERGG